MICRVERGEPSDLKKELLSDLEDRLGFAKSAEEVEEAYIDFDAEAELDDGTARTTAAGVASTPSAANRCRTRPTTVSYPVMRPPPTARRAGRR